MHLADALAVLVAAGPERIHTNFLDNGAYRAVYRVAPGLVVKIGLIDPDEVDAQHHLAAQARALPVLGYDEVPELPNWLERHACALCSSRDAGVQPNDGGNLSDYYTCSCGMQSAVLMPEAVPVAMGDSSPDDEIAAFMREIKAICLEELDRPWDAAARHVARYQGRLVALDFGLAPN